MHSSVLLPGSGSTGREVKPAFLFFLLEWMLMFVARRVAQKPTARRLGRSREITLIVLISSALCLGFFLVFGDSGYLELRKKEREIRLMELERDARLDKNRQIQHEIDRLKNDMNRIEELARQELKLTRDGEIVIQLQDKKTNPGNESH